MPTVHLICGPVGAGKTTVARRLSEEHRALRFSLDEWVMQLFGSEAPSPMVFEWWAEHCKRCSERIWSVCQGILAQGVDVILDLGFPARAQREEYRALAFGFGAKVHLHVVTADSATRWERVQVRNHERRETFALPVTEDMFKGSETWWEPPTDGELDGQLTVHSTEAAGELPPASTRRAPNARRPFEWGKTLPTVHGSSLQLRALESSDVPALYEIFSDPEVMRYWSRSPFDSFDAAQEFLEEIHSGFAERRLFQWGIAEPDTGEVVGTCTLFHFDREHRRCEVGFALARNRWGQGVARRAVGAALEFAFEVLDVHRIEADADPRNERCLRLLERLGFRREGMLRDRYQVAGELQDAVVFGLLRPDWRERSFER